MWAWLGEEKQFGVVTWYVAPAGVVELPAVVMAEPGQAGLQVQCGCGGRGVQEHLGMRRAAGAFYLVQEPRALCVVGGEDLGWGQTKKGEQTNKQTDETDEKEEANKTACLFVTKVSLASAGR